MKEDVNVDKEGLSEFDPKIRGLVGVLNRIFPEITYASCEGHLDSSSWSYPWVRLRGASDKLRRLGQELAEFNEQGDIKWEITGARNIEPVQETLDTFGITHDWTRANMSPQKTLPKEMTQEALIRMQESVGQLASFLTRLEKQKIHEEIEYLKRLGDVASHLVSLYEERLAKLE